MQRSANVLISVSSSDLSEDSLQDLTYELCTALRREIGAEAEVPEHEGSGGSKGGPVDVGTIILTLLGGGGVVVTLVNVLKAFVERSRPLSIKIKTQRGEIEVSGDSLRPEQIEQTRELILRVLGSEE